MITLALLDQMSKDNLAGLQADKDLFWEELPLQSNGKPAEGVWLVTRGGSSGFAGRNLHTVVDIFVAFNDKSKTASVEQDIWKWILKNQGFVKLEGKSGPAEYCFENIRLNSIQTPQNMGATKNGAIVKVSSVEIVYSLAKK